MILFLLLFVLFFSPVHADTRTDQPSPLFGDADGTNAGRYRSVKFPNGSTTNNVDGSVTIGWFFFNGQIVKGQQNWLVFKIIHPYSYYLRRSAYFEIWEHTAAQMTVNSLYCSADYDPATQYNASLYYADAYISKANPVVIQSFLTVNGVYSKTSSFTQPIVPASKVMYLFFNSTPDSVSAELTCTIGWYFS